MPQECTVNVRGDGELVTIEVIGHLAVAAEVAMDAAYQEACNHQPKNLLFKFDCKSRINSAGIAIMLDLVLKSRQTGIHVFITGVSKHFRKIFELVALTKYTTIVESEEEVRRLCGLSP